MSLPLLILRPLDGALKTERRARELELQAVVDPLFTVEPVAWSGPEATAFDALLLTSANAIRFGGPQLAAYRSLPVLAVGDKTAAAAREAGFVVDKTGRSGAKQLLSQLKKDRYRTLLWLAGEHHTDLSRVQTLETITIYRSRAIALGDKARACLAEECVILLHSVRAANQLGSECDRLHLPRSRHHLLAFSDKVADAAGQGWKSIRTADHPDDDALLSLASTLCRSC